MVAHHFNQVRVSRSALAHNYRLLQRCAGQEVRILAMVKADGYGHGMVEAATIFADCGCHDFGVAEVGEGVRLRQAGIRGDIFVFLGFLAEDLGLFLSTT